MNLTLQAFEANSPSGIDAAFVRMASDQAQALIILADSFMNGHVQKLDGHAGRRMASVRALRAIVAGYGNIVLLWRYSIQN
jgi:hypothetical protein